MRTRSARDRLDKYVTVGVLVSMTKFFLFVFALLLPVSSYIIVKVSSEMNAVLNAYEQNGYEAPWYGLSLTGDSKEDQIAIFKGYSSRFPSLAP